MGFFGTFFSVVAYGLDLDFVEFISTFSLFSEDNFLPQQSQFRHSQSFFSGNWSLLQYFLTVGFLADVLFLVVDSRRSVITV